MADARNLAWKLAMVRAGQAGDRLLDSYHEERHAVAELASRQALLRWENPRPHRDPPAADARRRVPDVPSTEDVAASLDGAPGSRIPHRWLNGSEVSPLDLNASRFAVLAGPAGEDWCEAARKVGGSPGIDLRTARPDGFIGWRSRTGGDPTALDEVLTSITGTEHA
ncbi:FAD-dependent monooxygenase [Streptomyces sp. NPDC020883]|uniref:FAD-dependent monooxygenase n=1 Tax=Streptomyces sp. NPDC020883 TaxID=3365099 RepID=UPI0037BCE300